MPQDKASPEFVKAGKPYRFQPGRSGNPGGPPKKIAKATDTAVDAMQAARARAALLVGNEDPRMALAAAQLIIDRALGEPKQIVETKDPTDVREMAEKELVGACRAATTERDVVAKELPGRSH